jgi:hypothetical protein
MKSTTPLVSSTSVTIAFGLSRTRRPPRRAKALLAETRCRMPIDEMKVTPDKI